MPNVRFISLPTALPGTSTSVDLASRAVKVAGDNTTLVVLGHALCCAHEGWTRRRPRERRAARYESQNAASRSRFPVRRERYYRLTNTALSDIIACENDHPHAGGGQRSRRPSPRREQVEVGLHRYALTGQGDVKALQGRGGYRLRIGGYRVIFDEDASTILAIYIGRRATTTYKRK